MITFSLPETFNSNEIKFIKNTELKLTQWVYTAGKNSEFLYTMSDKVCSLEYSYYHFSF